MLVAGEKCDHGAQPTTGNPRGGESYGYYETNWGFMSFFLSHTFCEPRSAAPKQDLGRCVLSGDVEHRETVTSGQRDEVDI